MSNVDKTEHGLDPGGGRRWDQLDVSRREAVQHICGEKGIALFSFLLESSTMMEPNQEECVVFSLQSLHDVAVQLGWSPDTVKRYVAVFRAVNLVHHHHDCRREVKLRLPLGPYIPLTNFSALDDLTGKRKKLRQLALKVKMRYIAYFGETTQTRTSEMQQTLREVKAMLDNERLEPLKRERLQMKIADMLTRLIGKDHVVGDLNELPSTQQATPEKRRPSISFTEGDSKQPGEVLYGVKQDGQGKEINQKEDSKQHEEGDPDQREGDSFPIASSTQEFGTEQMGDSKQRGGRLNALHLCRGKRTVSSQTARAGRPRPTRGRLDWT